MSDVEWKINFLKDRYDNIPEQGSLTLDEYYNEIIKIVRDRQEKQDAEDIKLLLSSILG